MILAGGPYVTKLAPDFLDAFNSFDAVFVGEAEGAWSEFLSGWARDGVPNLNLSGITSRSGVGTIRVPSHFDMDELPHPKDARHYLRSLFNVRAIFGSGAAPLEGTRGCPLKCSFCSTKQVWGAQVRRKSPARIVEEMKWLHSETGDKFFSLIGDNIGVPRARFLDYCRALSGIIGDFTWACSLKLDRISKEDLNTIWAAGCRGLFIGVETASEETLKKVNKAAILQTEIDNIYAAIEMGFNVETSFIVGFPWETLKDIKDTFNLHCSFLKAGANRSQIGALVPIPGTEIVEGAAIKFDHWRSYISEDDIPSSNETRKLIQLYPDLFAHMGHYETPNIERAEVWAYRDAAMRVAALYGRDRHHARKTNSAAC
jgi:anaerobic magnesium-protoporphyrin IX monomethyl ester cyclase